MFTPTRLREKLSSSVSAHRALTADTGALESYLYKKREAEDMLVVECESDSDEELIDSEENGDCEEDMNFVA